MSDQPDDEFYVGYLPTAPARIGKRSRTAVVVLLGGALLAAIVLVAGQQRLTGGTFEYQVYRDFEGVVTERPYPTLTVARSDADESASMFRYLLVGEGKHGAGADVAGFDGRAVRLEGSLIYRDGKTMIEVKTGSVVPTGGIGSGAEKTDDLGEIALVGEIVDSKCYLGVMNPGSSKPHRACAVRCISGGAPPIFVGHDASAKPVVALLVSTDGRAVNDAVLDFVAEPVEITGRLERSGDTYVLRADPATYRRVQ
jgi:hypothetical protein